MLFFYSYFWKIFKVAKVTEALLNFPRLWSTGISDAIFFTLIFGRFLR